MELQGTVTKRRFAGGSKSERPAVLLVTNRGEFVLRRPGGNPFLDPALEALVGKHITGSGTLHGYTFILTDWTESPTDGATA